MPFPLELGISTDAPNPAHFPHETAFLQVIKNGLANLYTFFTS